MKSEKKRILMRHGITDYNKNNILQGWKDIPINESGRECVLSRIEMIKTISIDWDIVISSDLLRARETGEIISSHLQIPLFLFPLLRERCYGKYEGMKIQYVHDLRKNNDLIEEYGGESKGKFCERVIEAMSLLEKNFSDKNLIIITHGAFIKNYARIVGSVECSKMENGMIFDIGEKVFI